MYLLWSIWIPDFFLILMTNSQVMTNQRLQLFLAKNWFLAGRATLTQIIFRSQHRHTCFLPKYWYIMEIHHKKWKISMCTCLLLTLAKPPHLPPPPKKKLLSRPYFHWNYLEKPNSARKPFGFFWLYHLNHKNK